MTKLNQIIAVEKGVRTKAVRDSTAAVRETRQLDRLSGIARTYQPRDTEGETLPSESTRVQVTVEQANRRVGEALVRLFDVVATKDHANTLAKADVVIDGELRLESLPPTFLLFLEKQFAELRTYIDQVPTLDPAFVWSEDPTAGEGVYRAEPVETTRTRKVPHNHIVSPATKEHPAQVQVFTTDEVIGDWTTTKFSGAITEERRQVLVERLDRLASAVKFAREEANNIEVTDQPVGRAIFDYLFA